MRGIVAFALLSAASFSGAGLITSSGTLAGSSLVIDFEQFDTHTYTPGPLQIGGMVGLDVTVETRDGTNLFYGPVNHGLGTNGSWIQRAVIVNSETDALVFRFNDGPVGGFGAFINYAPDVDGGGVWVEALDAGGNVLESYNLSALAPILTPDALNEGAFRGIQRGARDIAAVRYVNGYVAVDDLRFTQAVPEPGTIIALGLGTVFLRRRR